MFAQVDREGGDAVDFDGLQVEKSAAARLMRTLRGERIRRMSHARARSDSMTTSEHLLALLKDAAEDSEKRRLVEPTKFAPPGCSQSAASLGRLEYSGRVQILP
eukprot:gene1725-2386_t